MPAYNKHPISAPHPAVARAHLVAQSSVPNIDAYAQHTKENPKQYFEGCVVMHPHLSVCGQMPRNGVFENVAVSRQDVRSMGHVCKPVFGNHRTMMLCGPSKPEVHMAAVRMLRDFAPIATIVKP